MDDYRNEYMAVPPLLVSAAGLEAYLSMLSQQLQRDMTALRRDVAAARAQTSRACASMTRVKRYLGARAVREMQAQATRTAATLADAAAIATTAASSSSPSSSHIAVTTTASYEDSGSGDTTTAGDGPGDDDGDDQDDELEQALRAYSDEVERGAGATSGDEAAAQHDGDGDGGDAHTSSQDNRQLLLLLTLVRRLLHDNRALQRALERSTHTTRNFVEQQQRLAREVAQQTACTQRHRRDVCALAAWLGTRSEAHDTVSDLPRNDEATEEQQHNNKNINDDNKDADDATRAMGRVVSPEEHVDVDALVSRAPLLLALRRVLVRDLGDRLGHATTAHAREVGAVVSQLREDVATAQQLTPERVAALAARAQHDEAAALVRNYGERLRAIEANYVRRDEYASSMGTKADTLLLPVKADNATVVELERRLHGRCVELEERLAYFEAERDEMRRLVRALLQHTPLRPGSRHNSGDATTPMTRTTTTATSSSGNSYATTPSSSTPLAAPMTTRRTLYRVVGVDHNAFATPRAAAAPVTVTTTTTEATAHTHTSPAAAVRALTGTSGILAATTPVTAHEHQQQQQQQQQRVVTTPRTTATANATARLQREAVAWTPQQVPYARQVSMEMNERDGGGNSNGSSNSNAHHKTVVAGKRGGNVTIATLPALSTTATPRRT